MSDPRDLTQRDWGDRARSSLPPDLDPRRGLGRPAPGVVAPGPSAPTARSTGPAARALGWVAGVLSLVVLAGSSGGYFAVQHYGDQIAREKFLPGLAQEVPEERSTEARNILIIGSDSRAGLAEGEGVQGTGDEFVTGERSDTTIIAHIGRDGRFVQFLSFSRDSWVTIPQHTSPDGELVEEREARLNAAFQEGGAPLLVQTLNRMTGIYIDGVVKVDFNGFKAIVNALGGVEVCLPEAAKEKDSGIDLPAGRSVVMGDQALAYVRQRKELRRGDLDRVQRQQQFLGAVVREMADAGTLANPREFTRVARAVTGAIKVDETMSTDELFDIAQELRPEKVVFSTPPVADSNAARGRARGVVILDEAAAEALYRQIRLDQDPTDPAEGGTEPAGPPPVPTDLIVAPDRIRVSVFNAVGTPGLGARAARELTAVGFNVIGAPSDRGTGATRTVVLHGPERADSARTLAAAVPGAVTRLEPSLGRTLELLVGGDYTGARQVTVRPRPSQAPTGTPATTAPVTAARQDPCAV